MEDARLMIKSGILNLPNNKHEKPPFGTTNPDTVFLTETNTIFVVKHDGIPKMDCCYKQSPVVVGNEDPCGSSSSRKMRRNLPRLVVWKSHLLLLWVLQFLFLGLHYCCNVVSAFQPKQRRQQQYRYRYDLKKETYYYSGVEFADIIKFHDIPSSSLSSLYLSSSSTTTLLQYYDGDGNDDEMHKILQVQKEVESSKGMSNTKYLQKRFKLTDAWAKKASSAPGFTTMNRSTLIYRINWLQEQLDLNDAQCGKIIQRFPRIITLRPDTNLRPTFRFLKKKLAINTMELSKIVQQQPSILAKGIEEDQTLQRNINWMEKRLGLKKPKEKGKSVLRCAKLLELSVEGNLDPSFQMLQDRLEISDKQTAKMCRDFPGILACNFTTNIGPKLDMLQDRLDLNATQLGKLCLKAPQILGLNSTTNLEPKLDLLQERMGMNSTELGKLCLKAPRVLCYNYTTNIEPTIKWLEDRLRLNKNELKKVIKKQPTLLGCNPDSTFDPRLTWLHDGVGLNDDAIRTMIINQPAILRYTIAGKMEPLLQWLKKVLSLDDLGIQAIMVKQPTLFCCNITTNLEPTLDFYKMCVGEDEALELVCQQPVYFTYSLKRMQERYYHVSELGVAVNSKILWRIAKQKKSDWDAFIKRCQKEKDGT